MSVGSLFLKPEKLKRGIASTPADTLMEDLLKLASRIVLEQGKGGEFALALERSALAAVRRLAARIGDRSEAAAQKLLTFLQPLTDGIEGLRQSLPESGDTGGMAAFALGLLSTLADLVKSLSADRLRQWARDLLGILQDDLGLTDAFLQDLALSLLDDMAAQFEQLSPRADDAARNNGRAMARLLRGLRRRLRGQLALPALNPDSLASALMGLLRRLNIEPVMQRVQEVADALGKAYTAADSVLKLVPYTGVGSHSIGAPEAPPAADPPSPERQYCWYLSWLIGQNYRHRNGGSIALDVISRIFQTPFPADEVWGVDKQGDFVRRYLFHREERLFAAQVTPAGPGADQRQFFVFEAKAAGAAAAAAAARDAAQETSAAAARWENDPSMKDAFEEALDAARDALETALEYAEEARDAAQEADAAAASASEASARARDAGAAGYAAVNTADAAAQTAFGEWLSAYYFESGSGKAEVFYAVSAATEARDTALEAASRADRDHALGQVSKAYQEMISAAGLVADANSRASAEPSDNPAAAAESMQGMAAKAAEAAGAANSALSKARDALQGAEEAATAAQRALGSANTALQRAKEAQEALEQAQEGLSGTLASVYAVAVSAFETAAESVSDAADVSEDAADAALAAKRAAGYMVTGPRYSFGRIPPDDIEKWAFHTAYAADFLEMTLHGFSEEDGDFLSNLLLVLTTGTDAIFKLAADRPFYSWAVWPARLLSPMLGSFPYMHTEASAGNGMIFWLTYYGARGVEAHMYNFIAQNARDMLLSLLTLLNHDRSAEGSLPENFYMAEGVVQFLTWPFIFAWAAATPQEDYNVRNGRLWGIDWAVGGLVFTLLTSSLGALGALALAGYYKFWEAPGAAWEMWAHQLWKCAILSWVGYWPALFMIHENETDDGNYNPTGVTYVNGYPPRDSSPYLLPFEGGPVQCAQGNQGIWSHNNDTNQIYAYDFALDQGTEILASRSGTVVDWFDFAQDDENEVTTLAAADPNFLANRTNSDNWNFVTIRHDYDPANPANYPTVPDPGHDPVDAGGNGVYTYAVYGHGRNGSVREAFAARNPPVAPANIIGTRVARGEFIMRAGDTGMSAYNHLHMHVKTGPTPAAAGAPPTLDAGTIPFVFQDAQHRDMYHAALDDGIPRSLKFYRSDNTRP